MKKSAFISLLSISLILMFTGCTSKVDNVAYSVEYNGVVYDGEYTGTVEDSKPTETGKFVCGEKGDDQYFLYDGSWEAGKMKGKGTLTTNKYSVDYNGKTYEGKYSGAVKDAKPSGVGKFASGEEGDENYLIYEGSWEDGVFKGEGKITTNNYVVNFPKTEASDAIIRTGYYSGDVIDGVANGSGTFRATNDLNEEYSYEGEWKDGLFDGQGKMNPEDTAYYTEEGHFTKGQFDPSILELIKAVGSAKDNCPYLLSDEASKFISDNETVFTEHTGDIITELTNSSFSINDFKKNPNNVKPQFVVVNNLHLTQADEDKSFTRTYTRVLGYDSNDEIYSLFYIGQSEKLTENQTVNVLIMPHGYSTFKSTNGTTPYAITGTIVQILN